MDMALKALGNGYLVFYGVVSWFIGFEEEYKLLSLEIYLCSLFHAALGQCLLASSAPESRTFVNLFWS